MKLLEESETNFMLNSFSVDIMLLEVIKWKWMHCYVSKQVNVIIKQIFLWTEFMEDVIECTVTTILSNLMCLLFYFLFVMLRMKSCKTCTH
jgi:hypothetical protein